MTEPDITAIVEKMAALARLRFSPAELPRFAEKAAAVLAYVAQLNELDTSGIEPTSHAVAFQGSLREDIATNAGCGDEILAAAPARDGPFVQVPRVIDSE